MLEKDIFVRTHLHTVRIVVRMIITLYSSFSLYIRVFLTKCKMLEIECEKSYVKRYENVQNTNYHVKLIGVCVCISN